MMTGGTLFGLLAFKLFDTRHIVIGFGLGAVACLTVALTSSGEVARYALPAVGFFISVLWSSIMSLALNSVRDHHGSIAGILVTGVVGGAVVPLVMGRIGDLLGLRTGLLVLYLTTGYMISIGFWARPLVKNKTLRRRRRS
jgi:fucose permease